MTVLGGHVLWSRRGIFEVLTYGFASIPVLGRLAVVESSPTTGPALDPATILASDVRSSLERINSRCGFLRASGVVKPRFLSATVESRLPDSSTKYAFGFRDFIASDSNDLLVGMYLCSLYDLDWSENRSGGYRFFGVVIARPGCTPRPFEYLAGAEFGDQFIRTAPTMYQLRSIERYWSDRGIADWLQVSMAALQQFVETEARKDPLSEEALT